MEERQNAAFTATILICGNNIVVAVFVQDFNHISHNLGRLLQICIDKADIFATCFLETGIECSLLAKVTGEAHYFYGAFLLFVELAQVMHGGVLTTIIYKDDLVVIAAIRKCFDHSILEEADTFCLIIARNDKGKFHIKSSQTH